MPSEEQLSSVLSEFARTMVTDFPIQAILERLVDRIVAIMPITAAGVTLISPGAGPRFVAASDASAFQFEQLQSQLGEGPCIEAYDTGEAVAVADLRDEHRFPRFASRALAEGLGAVFTFPLRHGEGRLGALDLYRTSPGPLSSKSMSSAQTLADVAAAYLLNARARSELQESSERSRKASLHDALTGLPNRALILERIDQACLRNSRSGRSSAVLFIDLDRFKAVNDTYGHRVGDELLKAVAKRLSGLLRPGDSVARLAGDEFVILCQDLETRTQAMAIVKRVETALARTFVVLGTDVAITASVGIAFADRNNSASELLLHNADVAMYEVKRNGRTHDHDFELTPRELSTAVGLEWDLHWAIGRGELHTEYQPVVATDDGRILGVEALLRWMRPNCGAVPPTTFIPVAEKSGLIGEIGQWVLERAWLDRQHWQDKRTGDNLSMWVNISARQLGSATFAANVAAVLAAADADPQLLTLEVTESVFVRDGEGALGVLNDLKDIGVMLAIDDFGTGYSALSYLKRLPIDILKIDGEFVKDLGNDLASSAIVGAVVRLAHRLGMRVVAEGVETAAQHREVTELGCDFSQGYYFARPMTSVTFETLIHDFPDEDNQLLPLPLPAGVS